MTFVTQAIETKYLGPTNTKGGRIKATAWAGSVIVALYAKGKARNDQSGFVVG